MENQDSLFEDISTIAEQFKAMYDRAIIAYAPLVDDLCSRTASEKEVDWILTWLLDYAGEERMYTKNFDSRSVTRFICDLPTKNPIQPFLPNS